MTTKRTRTPAADPDSPVDHDAVVVGGGAGGLSAAVFLARYGLETLVLARGSSAIHQCAHLQNYLGFPGGLPPERFVALGRTQVGEEGGEVVEERVERVRREASGDAGDATGATDATGTAGTSSTADAGEAVDAADAAGGTDTADTARDGSAGGDEGLPDPARFRVETDEGRSAVATYVVAASAYDGDYLAAFEDDLDRSGEEGFVATDAGRTSVEGLYGVGWLSGETVHQAVANAGHGAQAALALIRDDLRARYWDAVADRYVDWLVDEGRYGGEGWEEHVAEWFETEMRDGVDVDDATAERAREDLAAEFLGRELSPDEQRRRDRRGQRLLLDHLDDEVIREYVAERDGGS